jgi:hypothetical protein
MIQTIQYFTKNLLTKANAVAVKRGYNRALRDEFISKLPDTLKFPVIHYSEHGHKGGMQCESHVRVSVAVGDREKDIIFLDCDWSLFYALPVVKLEVSQVATILN